MLDRSGLDVSDEEVQIIDEVDQIRFNPRALRQRGVFSRVATVNIPLVERFGASLTKLEISAAHKDLALADLDEMSINATSLFGDLDGAARTTAFRISS